VLGAKYSRIIVQFPQCRQSPLMRVKGEETEALGFTIGMLRSHLLLPHNATFVRTESRVGERHLLELLIVIVQWQIVDRQSIARNEAE